MQNLGRMWKVVQNPGRILTESGFCKDSALLLVKFGSHSISKLGGFPQPHQRASSSLQWTSRSIVMGSHIKEQEAVIDMAQTLYRQSQAFSYEHHMWVELLQPCIGIMVLFLGNNCGATGNKTCSIFCGCTSCIPSMISTLW